MTGTNNNGIEITPIKTIINGLCYKIQLSNSLPNPPDFFKLTLYSPENGRDKIEKIRMLIASNNTWQGIINSNWPYSRAPPLIQKEFTPNIHKVVRINLEENVWKLRSGIEDFNKCMKDKDNGKCLSLFDISPNEYKNG